MIRRNIFLYILATLIIVLLAGLWVYSQKNMPPKVNSTVVESTKTEHPQAQNTTLETHGLHMPNSKWIGTTYCSDVSPEGTTITGNYNRLILILTAEGKEVWAVNSVRTEKCSGQYNSRMYTVIDVLKYPQAESGLTLSIDSCSNTHSLIDPFKEKIVALLNEKQYVSSPTGTIIQPTQAWKVKEISEFSNPVFEEISVSGLTCYSIEPEPF